jgi:hypothetical protein
VILIDRVRIGQIEQHHRDLGVDQQARNLPSATGSLPDHRHRLLHVTDRTGEVRHPLAV